MQKITSKKNGLINCTRYLLAICVSLLLLHASANVVRVDKNVSGGNGSGSSWANAYSDLQTAIYASNSGDEVWVKASTYIPLGLNSSTRSFHMKDGVKIYGGFDGAETLLSQRDFTANITELMRFSIYPIIENDNISSSALLDGVRIRQPNGSGLGSNFSGGAMRNTGSSFPSISNVIFAYTTSAQDGGALYIEGGNSPITNVTFVGCAAIGKGGAIYMKNCTSTVTNVVFSSNNTQGSGGALYSEESAPKLVNVVFDGNYTSAFGGAVYCTNVANLNNRPGFTNVVFYKNRSTGSSGGGICSEKSRPTLTNCTFALNQCGSGSGDAGAAVYTFEGSASQGFITITNCLFKSNTLGTSATSLSDIAAPAGVQIGIDLISYSSFFNTGGAISGIGNVDSVGNPFVNINDGPGTDNIWMTADDGVRLAYCNSFRVVDKGKTSANAQATDIRGGSFDRTKDIGFIPDGGAGFIDMGAYEDQHSDITLIDITGSIGISHTVPFPKELLSDIISNTATPTVSPAPTYLWQSGTDSVNWNTASGTNNGLTYSLPSINQTTFYRRAATSSAVCGTAFYSNVVKITVIQPNGKIKGTVTANQSGIGVEGIVVQAIRQGTISGSPANYTYKDTTDNQGQYEINGIYYADNISVTSGNFAVTPVKANHAFNPAATTKTLSSNSNVQDQVNFRDTTVLSITGRTFQQCTTCNSTAGATETQTCPIDSIQILKGGIYATITGFIDTAYGRYAITVQDQSAVTIQPALTGHSFSPVFRSVTPTNNVSAIDFSDVSTHTITGKLSDGCGNYIGVAVLEFTDILPDGPNNTPRTSCFRKRVTTTTGTGMYSITLPARKYSVRVVSFTSNITNSTDPAYIATADLTDFVNTKIPKDSLTRNISTRDTTLNMMYQRPPVICITGGLGLICSGQFALLRQNETDSFKVRVYQGPVSLGCLLSDTSKVRLVTNVQQEDQLQELLYPLADTGTKVKIKGGIPNITGDRLKDLFVYFTDKYGRIAPFFNRKVLVTGLKSDTATFTTVSPEIPLVVLHDPPGDASSSTWQNTNSISNAIRFYTASSFGVEAWVQAKVGASATVGLGVLTDISVWGTIKGTIGVNATVTPSNEAIITTTTSQNFSTSGNPDVTGNSGDVYIGAALNMIYAVATEIGYNPATCTTTSARRLIVANNGFNTQYIYSEDYIVNTLIPNLKSLAILQPASAARYLNQVKVWQQVVDNNAENKRRAAFVQNYSFDGSAGPYTNTTTTSSSKTSSLEFAVDINAQIAAELGFEVAGSGVSGGVSVNFRVETGGSTTNTVTDETTIGYTLDDNTPGDYFSVNVKKDPVYNTPVFELAAGTASCPIEPGAQPRDAVFFTAVNPVMQGLNPANPANFNLKVVNTSPSTSTNPNDRRTYKLNYVQSSNVANETITIAGSPFQSNSPYILAPMGYLDSAIIPVSITRQSGSSVYSYESERFTISTACDEDLGKTAAVSAYFTSPCSGITLTQPADGWIVSAASGNQLFIRPGGYTLSALTSVNLQYSTGSTWTDEPPLTTAQLASGFNFNVASLPDGAYNIRLRLDCSSGTVYSQRASGVIDRKAPQLFGRPAPTDDNYVNGEVISFTYDEKLNANATGLQVTMRRLSNNQLIPATATIFDNKIIVTPTSSITGFNGDSVRLILSGINDVYGNIKALPDTSRFTIGTSVIATGNRALFVTITNPTVFKNNDTGAIKVVFNLPVNATNDTRVNYTIGGTARYGIDYTATYTGADALYASFNGSTGSIKIPNGSRQATLTITPIAGDTSLSPDKTIVISAAEGGDYSLGTPTSVTGTITSEDGISTYTFICDGNFTIKNNWLNGNVPLTTLVAPKEIIINPSGTCLLNIRQTIKTGAKITVKQNRRFVIQGSLTLKTN